MSLLDNQHQHIILLFAVCYLRLSALQSLRSILCDTPRCWYLNSACTIPPIHPLAQLATLAEMISHTVRRSSIWHNRQKGCRVLGDLVSQTMNCIACLEDPESMGNGLLIYMMVTKESRQWIGANRSYWLSNILLRCKPCKISMRSMTLTNHWLGNLWIRLLIYIMGSTSMRVKR